MSESQQAQRARVDGLIGLVYQAAVQLAECKARELELAAGRAGAKSEAIYRIMAVEDRQKPGKTYSATAAADLVNTDKVYALHLADERAATVSTIKSMGAYEAAKLRARFAICCAELEIIDDEPVSASMGKEHIVEVG